MSAATATAPIVNGHAGPNGATIKSSSAKSRSALKRLKAKKAKSGANGAASVAASESEVETDRESDIEVSHSASAMCRYLCDVEAALWSVQAGDM